MTKNDATNMLNNSKLDNKGSSWIWFWLKIKIDFGKNKIPVEIIKGGGAFGGNFFKDIYSGINKKWYRKPWKEFDDWKKIDQTCYCSNYYDNNVVKCGVKYGTSLRFWEKKILMNSVDPYGWFQRYFKFWSGRRW